jgi:hypothetical protein
MTAKRLKDSARVLTPGFTSPRPMNQAAEFATLGGTGASGVCASDEKGVERHDGNDITGL